MDHPGELPEHSRPVVLTRDGATRPKTATVWGSISQIGIFIILTLYSLHEIKPFLLPLVLAILVSLVLNPLHQTLRRIRVPRLLAAALTVTGLLGLLGFGAYQLAVPGARWFRSLDDNDLSAKLRETFRPITRFGADLREVADTVEQAASIETSPDEAASASEKGMSAKDEDVEMPPAIAAIPKAVPSPKPLVVEIHEDPLATAISEIQKFGVKTGVFLMLVLFILAYGNRFVRRLGSDTGTILERMAADVSRYLFTITVINTCLGIFIGLAMWAFGMPNPALWGLLGMVLNYIPYVGALIGALIVFLVAAVNFESVSLVLLVPLTYLILTSIEGNLVTPLTLGGRFRLNPLVVIVWLVGWAAFWGIAGMLIAMPTLMIFKIACENISALARVQRMLDA